MPKVKRVITLPLRPKPPEKEAQEKRKLRVAAYARVSSNQAEQLTSFIAQQRHYEILIKSDETVEFSGIYADEGKSGTSLKRRSEFSRLMGDCRAGRIDRILTKSISRFGRNVVDCLESVRELKAIGVDVYFEKENIHTLEAQGELLLTIMSALAESESWNLSDNIKWGLQRKYEQGQAKSIPSGKFLGYDKDGEGNLVIVEAEARIVRRIYQEFLDGFGYCQIAGSLTKDRVPTEQGNEIWSFSTIKKILTNEKYKGDTLFLKTFNADPLTKRRVKNDGLRPQTYVKNTHAAIIDEEMWACVQQEFLRQAMFSKAHRLNVFHHHSEKLPLCGKVICGTCGGVVAIRLRADHPSAYWRCLGVKRDIRLCANRQHIDRQGPERALLLAWNDLVKGRVKLSPQPEDDVLTGYRKRELQALLDEYGELETMSYELITKVLDHILVDGDHFKVSFLARVSVSVPIPQNSPKGPRWTSTYNPQSRLAQLRIAKGLTQTALGNLVGLTQQQIQSYENGRCKANRDAALAISRELSVNWQDWQDVLPQPRVIKPPTRLKEIRLQRGYSQSQLARIIGMDRKYYCRIEDGTVHPSENMAKRISRGLGVMKEVWLDS